MRHGSTRFPAVPARRALLLPRLLTTLVLLLPAAIARAEDWTLPDSRLGVRTAPILLLSRADVQADLKLSGEQILSARRAIADLHARAAALRGRPDAEVVASRRLIDEAQQRWLDQQLSEPQRHRLLQIDLQWEGPMALVSRPWLAEQLALTAEQRAAIGRLLSPSQGAPAHPPAEAILQALQPEQRQQWLTTLGPAFAVQTLDAQVRPASAPAAR